MVATIITYIAYAAITLVMVALGIGAVVEGVKAVVEYKRG